MILSKDDIGLIKELIEIQQDKIVRLSAMDNRLSGKFIKKRNNTIDLLNRVLGCDGCDRMEFDDFNKARDWFYQFEPGDIILNKYIRCDDSCLHEHVDEMVFEIATGKLKHYSAITKVNTNGK